MLFNLLSASFLSEGSLVDGFAHCAVDNWNVRQDQSYVFLCNISIAIKVISKAESGKYATYMSKLNFILVSKLL